MVIAAGKVVGGRVELESELPEGASVTVLALEGDETFEADPETERMLLDSIAQCERGETIPLTQLRTALSSRGTVAVLLDSRPLNCRRAQGFARMADGRIWAFGSRTGRASCHGSTCASGLHSNSVAESELSCTSSAWKSPGSGKRFTSWRRRRVARKAAMLQTVVQCKLLRAVLHCIDTRLAAVHSTIVNLLLRRTAAFFVVLTLAAAGWAECAGWQAAPEARMACCSDHGDCPMHGSTGSRPVSGRVVTQAQADSCCAASGTDDSTPSAVAFSLSLSAVLVPSTLSTMPPVMVPPASFAAWRIQVPLPPGHAPKHVLLSVFLI